MNERERLDLGDLPNQIAALQQPLIDNPQPLRRTRTQLLLSARGRALGQKPTRSLRAWLWAPVALTVAVTALLLVLRPRDATLSFRIGDLSGQVGKSVHVSETKPMTLEFSDGTALSLAPGSRVRVNELDAEGAGVVLEDGELQAAVVHRARSRWLLYAGPYRVLVTGTRFNLRWNQKQESFDLDLHDGSVTVFGPTLGSSGKGLRSHDKLHLGPQTTSVGAAKPAPAAAEPSPFAGKEPPAVPPISPPPAPARTSWKSLALAGNYAEAFAAAEKEGFSTLCRQNSAADLLLLGNTARLAKKVPQAEEAYQAARSRPGAGHQRALAAFQLGRLAQDARGDHARAANWFETYLNEAPTGPLAREAAGRVMEAHQRAGNTAAARVAARRYLARYPGGPYASLAQRLSSP